MIKIFNPHLPIYLLFFIFVLIFKTNATAQNSKNIKLENDMVKIPAGSFLYGTNKKDDLSEALLLGLPKPWYADEGPEQIIFLKTYFWKVGKYLSERWRNCYCNPNC